MAQSSPWNADPKWQAGSITLDEVERLEREGSPEEVVWPLGSPRNYFLGVQLKQAIRENGQEFGESTYLGIETNGGDMLDHAFPGQWHNYRNDHDPYVYTFRNEDGTPYLVTETEVLNRIGRSYGQTGA